MTANPYEPANALATDSSRRTDVSRHMKLAMIIGVISLLLGYRYLPLFIGFQPTRMTPFHWLTVFVPTFYLLIAAWSALWVEYRATPRLYHKLPFILAPTLAISIWILFVLYWDSRWLTSAPLTLATFYNVGVLLAASLLLPYYFWVARIRARTLSY